MKITDVKTWAVATPPLHNEELANANPYTGERPSPPMAESPIF